MERGNFHAFCRRRTRVRYRQLCSRVRFTRTILDVVRKEFAMWIAGISDRGREGKRKGKTLPIHGVQPLKQVKC